MKDGHANWGEMEQPQIEQRMGLEVYLSSQAEAAA
jgi:hypothetical protein